MTNDPIAHWLQSQACLLKDGMYSTWLSVDSALHFKAEGSAWAVYIGCTDLPQLMRIGTCQNLADVKRIFTAIVELNPQHVRVPVSHGRLS